jgi:hypothetical protein
MVERTVSLSGSFVALCSICSIKIHKLFDISEYLARCCVGKEGSLFMLLTRWPDGCSINTLTHFVVYTCFDAFSKYPTTKPNVSKVEPSYVRNHVTNKLCSESLCIQVSCTLLQKLRNRQISSPEYTLNFSIPTD